MKTKPALTIDFAYKLGLSMALGGKSEIEVGERLVEMGYSPTGLSASRVARGYRAGSL